MIGKGKLWAVVKPENAPEGMTTELPLHTDAEGIPYEDTPRVVFWCADGRVAQAVQGMERLEDAQWVCETLNKAVIDTPPKKSIFKAVIDTPPKKRTFNQRRDESLGDILQNAIDARRARADEIAQTPVQPDEPSLKGGTTVQGDITAESFVIEWWNRGSPQNDRILTWEKPYQDAGLIQAAADKGYIDIGRNPACTLRMEPKGQEIINQYIKKRNGEVKTW